MITSQFFSDLSTNCLTEVAQAATSYYNTERGLTVRQSFYIYPNGTIVCLNSCDGGYTVQTLDDDNVVIFNRLYH